MSPVSEMESIRHDQWVADWVRNRWEQDAFNKKHRWLLRVLRFFFFA